jgi:hypothetical protein
MRPPCTLMLLAITVAVSALILGGIAQAADNQAGTWKLNVAKSKYSPGPAPKDGTLTIESQADGLKFTIHGTDAEGKAVHFEMSPKYDGKDYQHEENRRQHHRDCQQEGRQIHIDSPQRGLQRWQDAHVYAQRD